MNWKRIASIATGAAGVIGWASDYLPSWVGVVGGVVAGVAVNAERIMAKRASGAPTFSTPAAEAKVARMFPPNRPEGGGER